MRASQLSIPGVEFVDVRQHANRGADLPGDPWGRYRLQVPFLLLVFNDQASLNVPGDPAASAEALANTLRTISFPNISAYYLENSYGTFDFDFRLRTAILDRPKNDRGNAPVESYDSNNLLENGDQFPRAVDYTGFRNFIVYEKDPVQVAPDPEDNPVVQNYNAQSERNYALAALTAAALTSHPWDDPISFEEWIDFGIPPGDSGGFFLMASPSLDGGGWRPDGGGFGFGTYLPDGSFKKNPIEFSGRTLKDYVFAQWTWETFAHELGHAIVAPDLYGKGSAAGFLGDDNATGSVSFMAGSGTQPHMDALRKFRWGWTDPQVIIQDGHDRRIVLPPVYEVPQNTLLIRPDPEGHPDELFLVEMRRAGGDAWNGNPKMYDQGLLLQLQGVHVYHVNALGETGSQPEIDLEGEDPSVSPLDAFQAGESLTPPASDFYDGSPTGLTIQVEGIDGEGRATLDIRWAANAGELEVLQSFPGGALSRARLHSGWRETWTVAAGNFSWSGFDDLLLYDRTTGEVEILQGLGNGGYSFYKRITGWRRTWSLIIPGNFTGSSFTDVWLYDRRAGVGELLVANGHGRFDSVIRHENWRRTWTHIVAGDFGGTAYSDLLFYDAAAGQAEFYTVLPGGELAGMTFHENWRRTWDAVVVGQFGGSSAYDDLLLYDRRAGEAEFYTVRANGEMTQGETHAGWRRTWQIRSGQLGGGSNSDLLLYDRTAGEAELHTVQANGAMSFLQRHTDWRRTWDEILLSDNAGSTLDDVVLYGGTNRGEGEFLAAQNGGFESLARIPGWRKTWHAITPGTAHGGGRTNLHFYDPTAGELATYRTNGAGDMDFLSRLMGLRGTFDLIVAGNFDAGGDADLLCYDPAAGELVLFNVAPDGTLTETLVQSTRKTWTHIAAGRFRAGARDEVFLYDRLFGEIALLRRTGGGNFAEWRSESGWARTFDAVAAGRFLDGVSGLALYDPVRERLEVHRVAASGAVDLVAAHDGQGSAVTHLAAGDFDGDGRDDLLLYSSAPGSAEVRLSDGSGGFQTAIRYDNWRRTWNRIAAGDFSSGSGRTDLLLYTPIGR